MLVINPEECIDCNLCVPECPVEAIFPEDEIPKGQEIFLEINARLSQKWPVLSFIKPSPVDADEWKDVPDKLAYLDEGEESVSG
jgi:ferredoxin